MNNNGYVSIFQTHRNFFNEVEVGGSPKSGVTFPDFGKLVQAFGFPYVRAERHDEMDGAIRKTLEPEGPADVIRRDHLMDRILMEEVDDGIILRSPTNQKLSFSASFAEMATDKGAVAEVFTWAESGLSDGLEQDTFEGWPR